MDKIFTIEQKLAAEELTSRDASGTVRLYREGNFYVAYQGSAVLFQRYLKGDLKMLRVVRKSGVCYIKAGVPLNSKCLKGLIEVEALRKGPVSDDLSVESGLAAILAYGWWAFLVCWNGHVSWQRGCYRTFCRFTGLPNFISACR